jgi:MYXO-CTERM domain-containing protein
MVVKKRSSRRPSCECCKGGSRGPFSLASATGLPEADEDEYSSHVETAAESVEAIQVEPEPEPSPQPPISDEQLGGIVLLLLGLAGALYFAAGRRR